jgi:hypothetical protein
MAGTRIKFNWSILDRSTLKNILWILAPDITSKQFTSLELHKILSKKIKEHLPIKITRKYSGEVVPGTVYIAGTYYCDNDKAKQKCIEIVFLYNPFDRYIKYNKIQYKRMCNTFADTVLHEIIHMRQHRRRRFKSIPDYESDAEIYDVKQNQSYLGNADEIDAYGFNIACELLDKFKDTSLAADYLEKKHRRGSLKSFSLRTYLSAFNYDSDHIVIKKLKKKVLRYFSNAEIGKPFKNKNWIDR